MNKPFSIWSPVISAQLNKRRIKSNTVFPWKNKSGSIADIKIKIRHSIASLQGSSVYVRFQLEFLCLMEDLQGEMLLTTWTGECQDRIALTEFDHYISAIDKMNFILNLIECDGIGALTGEEICLDYYIDYSIIAAHEQIIEISPAQQTEAATVTLKAALQKLEDEVLRVEVENGELRKRLFIYERDISSLKRGLWKAENRNAVLNREKKEHQAMIEKLSAVIRQHEIESVQIKRDYASGAISNQVSLRPEDITKLGGRIKRMFMNSN